MEINTEKRLKVERLLLQREALFARIHELEARVESIFGDAWDFCPPDLPSMRKPVKKRRPGKPGARPLRLPPLEEGESAYRISYQQGDLTMVETLADTKALLRLLTLGIANLKVEKLATVDADGGLRRDLTGDLLNCFA